MVKLVPEGLTSAAPCRSSRHVKFAFLVRQGEDVRYGVDDAALRALGWKNRRVFEREIPAIVRHYKNTVVW